MRVKIAMSLATLLMFGLICGAGGCRNSSQAKLPTQAEVAVQVQKGVANVDKDPTKTPEEKEKLKKILIDLAAGSKTAR
jgi:hypothetical protein